MASLHSPRWHRVAGLRPRLSRQARVRRQLVRGERWTTLSLASGGRSVRLNAVAYALVGRMNGRHAVEQLWQWQLARPGDPATQDEIIDLLAQLREAALLQFDHEAADFDLLLPHLKRVAGPRDGRSLLAWRIPLCDPSRWLDRLQGLARLLFSRRALALWLLAIGAMLLLLTQHAPALWAFGERWLATPRFAVLAAVLYVPIKLVHELAHGLALRRWGGVVHEAGVTLMLGMPVPYVDASGASAFVHRSHRVVVGAAGVMAELALAAGALPLWLTLDDGLARDAAFATLFIAGVSTLLFNANPLQRLDGYYVVTDWLDLPNLATRSRTWWWDLLHRRWLGLAGAEAMSVARGEAAWLAAYAPLSWLYGIGVAAVAVLWLGHLSLVLGLAAGTLLGWQMIGRPAVQFCGRLHRTALSSRAASRRWRRFAIGAVTVLVLVAAIPLPQRVLAPGVVWPADQAQLRADEAGFVVAVRAADGEQVEAGTLVLQLANPSLGAELARQRARVEALETELIQALPDDGSAAGNRRAELVAAQAGLDRLLSRMAALDVRSRTAGRVVLPQAADLSGQFVQRGRLLGQVLAGDAATVRVAMVESDAGDLQGVSGAASVRLASGPASALRGTLLRDSAGAAMALPSAALSQRHGGVIRTDPGDDLRPLQPVVLLDVQLDASAGEGRRRLGERAWVRFETGYAPLAVQALHALQRALMQRFNPQF